VKKINVVPFPFPAVSVISIEAPEHHQSILVIKERTEVDIAADLSLMEFPGYAGSFRAPANEYIGDLQLILGTFQIINDVEDRMIHFQVHPLPVGKHSFHFPLEVGPLRLSPKIVCHKKTAV